MAQNIKLDNSSNVLVRGKIYKLQIVGNKVGVKNYVLETDNGVIERQDSDNFTFTPKEIGTSIIYMKNNKGEIISSEPFRIRNIIFKAWLVGYDNNNNNNNVITNSKRLSVSIGLDMYSQDLACSDIPHTGNYDLVIIKQNNAVYRTSSGSLRWSEETRKNFEKLESGDLIMIYNIVFNIENQNYIADPLFFEVKL